MSVQGQRSRVLAVSLMAALALSACGKKKEIYGGPEAQDSQATKVETAMGDLPGPSMDSDEGPLPGPGPRKAPTAQRVIETKEGPVPQPPLVDGRGQLPPVAQSRPIKGLDLNPIPADYKSNQASQVERDGLSKRITGGQTSDGMLYTSSSTDNIHAVLRARNEKVGYAQKRLNMEMAASVQSASLHVDALSGEATVVVKMAEGNSQTTYVLAGALGEGSAQRLKVVRGSATDKTTGRRAVEASIKCLDLDGGCENTFARLRFTVNGSPSVVNIVFRQSSADAFFQLPGEYSNNTEYLYLREFIHNSIKGVQTDNKISEIQMNAFEVVNGRSGFDIQLKGRNKELLGFRGPLLAPEAGSAVNVQLARIGKEANDTMDLISMGNVSLKYANYIQEARLVNNNGLGQVRFVLKMRKRAEYAQDQFAVTIMRRVKPLIELSDESLQ